MLLIHLSMIYVIDLKDTEKTIFIVGLLRLPCKNVIEEAQSNFHASL